ncbi:MAG: hypothetical protein JKY23_05395 [Nitrospinaceae bacterium]|nr:hypothetical protein [Nitrospinaceae bacterium]
MHNLLAQIKSKTSLAVGRDDRLHPISEVVIFVESPDHMVDEKGYVVDSTRLEPLRFGLTVKGLEALEAELKTIRAKLTRYGIVCGQYNSSIEVKAKAKAKAKEESGDQAPGKAAKPGKADGAK